MALTDPQPVSEVTVSIWNSVLGTPTGSKVTASSPVRGRVIECGFAVNSLVASAITLSVSTDDHISATASAFAQIVSSTLGTFASGGLYEGATASVVPPSPSFVAKGAAIQWVTSGGNTSAIGGTVYAIIRRA